MPDIDEPDWYVVPLERQDLRLLQRRTNYQGALRLLAYLALLALFASLCVAGFGTGWTVLFFILYGCVFTYSDSIEHETHHRTAFRSIWLNEVVHWVAGVLTFNQFGLQGPGRPPSPRPGQQGDADMRPAQPVPQGGVVGPCQPGLLRRRDRPRPSVAQLVADSVPLRGPVRGNVHGCRQCRAPRRFGRKRAGLAAQHEDRPGRAGYPAAALEHELPPRAPHVPHGAISCSSPAPHFDRARVPTSVPVPDQRLAGDVPDICETAPVAGVLCVTPSPRLAKTPGRQLPRL